MLDVVPTYVDYCSQQYEAAKVADSLAIMEIEQKLDLTEYVPESFGTADCVILSIGTMEVIDYKHGKGVPVYPQWNNQLMLYGLGAMRKYDMLYSIDNVRLTIVQPRIDNISSWEISVDELLEWAENTLKPAAQLAFEGKGELNAGNWCKFCAVKNRCRKLYEANMELAKYEFAQPALLSDEEISDILSKSGMLVEWANSIHEYALDQAIKNKKVWPGYKLVEGTSRRKWIDDEEKIVETIFEKIPEASEDEIYDSKLKSITNIEKLYGKKKVAAALSSVIVKSQGKPTLVPQEDKRPALGIEDAVQDFK
jgi:hypothetical protein